MPHGRARKRRRQANGGAMGADVIGADAIGVPSRGGTIYPVVMVAQRIDGKALAQELRTRVKARAEAFERAHGRKAGLEVILVGDPASVVYTRNKEKAAIEVGVRGKLHRLPADTSESALLALVGELNRDPATDGILVQLPLPKHIREISVLDAIDPAKDVDGFHPVNAGLLASGRPALAPCTPRGSMMLLAKAGVSVAGKDALVIGRSNIVGKPIAQLLLLEHATVTIAHSKSRDLASLCRRAEIVIAAVGRAHLVKGDWLAEGATVIDVGINRTEDGKLVGDVDTEAAMERASAITPVPGGVGPMTIACLLENTLIAAEARIESRARVGA
jgi:methylenetetrahydrofolate dehydrogenase (NADP+) / methenyltetrahydrofolate cyclohydrolase